MERETFGYIMMISVAFLWGVGYTAIKILLQVMDPFTLGAVRFAISSIFFVPIIIILWKSIMKKDLIIILIMGLTGITFYQVLYNSGAEGVTAGLGSILVSTEPIFIYLLSIIFFKESFKALKILGIMLSFSGITLIFFKDIFSYNGLLSILLIIFASISWSIYTLLSKMVIEKYGALFVTSISSIFGTIFLIPFLFNFPIEEIKFNLLDWFSLIFLAIFTTIVAFYLNFKGIEILSPTKASTFYYLAPVFTILSAYFLIHEIVSITSIIGGILIILGVAIVNRT